MNTYSALERRRHAALLATVTATVAAAITAGAPLAAADEGYDVGDTFPGFAATTLQGEDFTFDDLADQYVLIDFCAIWCAPCQSMAPDADDVSDALNAEDIPFAYVHALLEDSVAAAADQTDAQNWSAGLSVPSPPVVILHPDGVSNSPMYQAFVNFGTDAFPTLVLLDPDGVILEIIAGVQTPAELIALVESHADDPALCPADVTGDTHVDVLDLLTVLGEWGACGVPCDADTNEDSAVDVLDLLAVLGAWGPCGPA